jgi:hypothetical protein
MLHEMEEPLSVKLVVGRSAERAAPDTGAGGSAVEESVAVIPSTCATPTATSARERQTASNAGNPELPSRLARRRSEEFGFSTGCATGTRRAATNG